MSAGPPISSTPANSGVPEESELGITPQTYRWSRKLRTVSSATNNKIALIGYPPQYFHGFAAALEAAGSQVFWVHGTRGAARYQQSKGLWPPERVLDTTLRFVFDPLRARACAERLTMLEATGLPRVNDIILMDRILRHKRYDFAVCYLDHLQQVLTRFFGENGVSLVSSGRDSALQLMSMLVCGRLGLPWVVPTRLRIPQDVYMFSTGHETEDILAIRTVTATDYAWAREFLASFINRGEKPALKASTRTFYQVLRMMPRHARLFAALVRQSKVDAGNDYSRYTISHIAGMYIRRRINLALYKAFPPYRGLAERPFCLYALHTQPESSIDVSASFFSDQIALITLISRALPVSHELYVKIHPTDVDGKSLWFYRKIAKIPGVRLISADVDSRPLIERASIVFTLTGTIGYEAGLMGKAVVTFARNFFNAMPTVRHCACPRELPAVITSSLTTPPPADLLERVVSFLAYMRAQSFAGEVNRMYLPAGELLTRADLNSLTDAYNTLFHVFASGEQRLRHDKGPGRAGCEW